MKKTVNKFSHFINKMEPTQIMVMGFALVILIGAILLNLPISTKNGEKPFSEMSIKRTFVLSSTDKNCRFLKK